MYETTSPMPIADTIVKSGACVKIGVTNHPHSVLRTNPPKTASRTTRIVKPRNAANVHLLFCCEKDGCNVVYFLLFVNSLSVSTSDVCYDIVCVCKMRFI